MLLVTTTKLLRVILIYKDVIAHDQYFTKHTRKIITLFDLSIRHKIIKHKEIINKIIHYGHQITIAH